MKRILIVLALLILVSFPANGQVSNPQQSGNWNSSGLWDLWKVRTDSVLADTFWVTGADTAYSEVMLIWPLCSLAAEVGDSTSTDSSGYKVNLYQWIYYRSNATYRTSDLGKFVFVRTLTWNGETEALANQSTIAAAGSYLANLTDEAVFVTPFFRYEIIGTAANKAGGSGSWIKLVQASFSGR